MQIVLMGNANSGKTSLFNMLTGARQHVGNWPGVTVEKKEGEIELKDKRIRLVDLPGIYTLDPDSIEQKVSRDYLFNEKPELIINILDATNIERSLFLTLQLREFGIPMLIALNMMDEIKDAGIEIDMKKLSMLLGVPVIGLSAMKGTGIEELKNVISDCLDKKIEIKPFCSGCSNCTKCKEGEYRYRFIENIVSVCVKHTESHKSNITERLDRILLNRFLAIPMFFLIMLGIFTLTFGPLTEYISNLIEYLLSTVLQSFILNTLTAVNAPAFLVSLICTGIIPGIGTVLTFLPQIALLFILMSFLEDSGYMSRAAFIMDKLFSYFGLTGSSFIPLMMGFGCSVPAIMSCRILPTEKDRRLTIMLTSFVSCSARLPLYALLAGVFFGKYNGLMIFLIYMLGILVAILSAFILNRTLFKTQSSPFVMEIPPYRLPKMRNLLLHTWDKVKGFLIKAGTTLLIASIIIWFLQSFTPTFKLTDNPSNSIIALIGGFIAPIFVPLGFGNWQVATALLTGVAAKEMIVSTLSILTSSGGQESVFHAAIASSFTPLSAFSLMSFALLYLPCVSAIITMKREFNSIKWTIGSLFFSFSVAWFTSFVIYSIGRVLGF